MDVAFRAGIVEGIESFLDQVGVIVARRSIALPFIVAFKAVEFFRRSFPLSMCLGLNGQSETHREDTDNLHSACPDTSYASYPLAA